MKKLIYFLFAATLFSCHSQNKEQEATVEEVDSFMNFKCCPPTIYLQPCNSFTQAEARAIIPNMRKELVRFTYIDDLEIVVKPNIKLPDSLLNTNKTRYRADKIVKYFSKEANDHNVIIALLHQDVSTSLHGKADWGVLGLSLQPLQDCVVSDYRLKNKKRDLWKVVVHEFVHTYFIAKHCAQDDPKCIMQDAKGHADFSNKTALCDSCSRKYRI